MKKILFIGAMAAMTLSCSSDDDGDAKVSAEGTWKLTKFETTEGIDFDNDGNATKDIIAETDCFGSSTLVLSDEDVAVLSMQSIDADPVANGEGGYDYNVTCNAPSPVTGTYSVTSNTVLLNAGSEPISLLREGNRLTFSLPQFFTVPIEQNGEITEVSLGVKLEFTKQ